LVFGSIVVLCLGQALAQPQVDIESGTVEGRRIRTHYEADGNNTVFVNSFYGIPYAEAPIGDRRFTRADPVEPWEGVFEAKSLGSACMQGVGGLVWITHPGFRNIDEDCLNLNVFTPENMNPDEPYPVMVWFYGGAFSGGTNVQYPGHFLAARDVVVVAVNYRVGIFGFITTDDEVAPGNYGLWDQHLSLQWVQSNIAAFGGNPDKVTIFGQSAGGASVSHHIMSPHSEGLFHNVIAESGTDMNFWSLNYPQSDPVNYTIQVAERFDCPTDDSLAMVDCLRGLEQWELRNKSGVTCSPGHFCLGHQPVVDGPGGFIPDMPYLLRERGEFNQDIKLMSGFLSDDGSFYTVAFIPESMEGGFTREEFHYYLQNNLLNMWAPSFDEKTNEDIFRATDFQYTNWPYIDDLDLNRDAFNMMITDAAFGYVVDKQLISQSNANGGGNYKFMFGYRSNATLEGQGFWNGTEWAGVPHAGELPYVFGWANMKLAPQVRADARIPIDVMNYNEEDFLYTDLIMDLWTNFAKFGNPTPEPIALPLGGEIQFEEFTEEHRNTMYIMREVKNDLNYRIKYNAFIQEYCSYIIDRPLLAGEAPRLPLRDADGMDPDIIFETEQDMVKEFLTKQYPGQFEHLYDEEF